MAGAATLETNTQFKSDHLTSEYFENFERQFSPIGVSEAINLYPEAYERAEGQLKRQIGSVALRGFQDMEPVPNDSDTLLTALKDAKTSDEALKSVKLNISTDVAERLFKTGHQTIVPLEWDWKIVQNGRPLIEINRNTFSFMDLNDVMAERTKIECRNTLLFEELIKDGALDLYDAVVFSNTPIDLKTREDYGFFTDTDSVSIQFLTKNDQKLQMETAMVAGKVAPDSERHDFYAISKLIGQEINESDNELLNKVMLIPKKAGQGVQNIVEAYDATLGEVFYGEKKPIQDYEIYREVCAKRTTDFEDIVENVLQDLLARVDSLESPYQAIELLDKLSDKHCVNAAISRQEIDTRVFGAEAASHIEEARFFQRIGDEHRVAMSIEKAVETSTGGSCPFSRAKGLFGVEQSEDGLKSSTAEDKYGSLQFKCKKGHSNTRPRGKLIEKCQVCNMSVRC